ncbi:phosphotriesterase-related protein [Terrabacter sp. NPDC080008]|uniref:phosphotriesterase family protein n=1 Tax=Terrabacter sp. NPDC080008 TaxID=3155176 RepID=UPI00344CE4D1
MTTVMTVTGPVDAADLGTTLTHEHIVNDVTSWWQPTCSTGWDPEQFAEHPVTMDIVWDLKQDPFGNRDNCRLDDEELAVAEVGRFAGLGGSTIIDATGLGIGRDLPLLRRVSERTGVRVVAGTGYYLDGAMPQQVKGLSPEAIAEHIVEDVSEGVDGIRPGIIGEIGVSADFTPAERASLEGALRAQRELGLPVEVHLPGWFRRGGEVLDLAERHGVDPAAVVLCHMGPSGDDLDYQMELLRRGAWVQYDMIGMEVFYADQGVQCPSDEENAQWLCRLAEAGHLSRLLISQDIFVKSLLRHYGGPGYGHILQYFVPRLRRLGMTAADIDHLLITNPRTLFETAQKEN